jgi:hypothetical protein
MNKRVLVTISYMLLSLMAVSTISCGGSSPSSSSAPSSFEVISFNVIPAEVIAGKAATVTARIANSGTTKGTYNAILTINDAEAEKKEVAIPQESIETVTFTLNLKDSGTCTVKLGELSQNLVVKKLVNKEVELKYDDGSHREHLTPGPKRGYLIDFQPPAVPFKIQKVRIRGVILGTGWERKQFEVTIAGKDRKILQSASYPVEKFELDKSKWVDLDFPPTEVSDTFFVYIFTGTGARQGIYIGMDDSVPNTHSEVASGKSLAEMTSGGKSQIPSASDWTFSRDSWFGDQSKVNWMIRVVGTGIVTE